MGLSSWVVSRLKEAGLERYAPSFSRLADTELFSLLLADFASYGVDDVGDKHKLFK
jgi:hypothetical protein